MIEAEAPVCNDNMKQAKMDLTFFLDLLMASHDINKKHSKVRRFVYQAYSRSMRRKLTKPLLTP